MIKAIFLDIDGTLVSFNTKKIIDSTIEALKMAHQRGIKIFIATGRPNAFINNITPIQELGLIDGYVTMNGSYCFVGDEVIFKNPIPKDEARAIAEFCEKENFTCVFVGEKRVAVRNPTPLFINNFYTLLHVNEIPITTLDDALSFETFQLSPFFSKEQEGDVIEHIPGCEVGRWCDDFADIGAKGNTKQLGIDKMIAHFGISLDETMAIGDGGNDISMLKHAAIGVAMGNADDTVKAAANYVTKSVDEGGIAHALRHFAELLHHD